LGLVPMLLSAPAVAAPCGPTKEDCTEHVPVSDLKLRVKTETERITVVSGGRRSKLNSLAPGISSPPESVAPPQEPFGSLVVEAIALPAVPGVLAVTSIWSTGSCTALTS